MLKRIFFICGNSNSGRMKRLSLFPVTLLLLGFFLNSCSRKTQPVVVTQTENQEQTGGSMALPPCIIYKTKADYHRNVPVSLSSDQSKITSYPDVSDLRAQGKSAFPEELSDGFLLDNRGIGPDVAFLTITYDVYASQSKTPSADDLFKQLLDNDPLLEMYQCGNRYQYHDIVRELNELIDSGKLSDCRKIK